MITGPRSGDCYAVTNDQVRAAILEIQVNAALAGHDLGPFVEVDTISGGYEVRCRKCGQSAWVGESGLMYSLLGYECKKAHHLLQYDGPSV